MATPSHIPARVAADANEADATLASLVAAAAAPEVPPAPVEEPTPAPAPGVQPVDMMADIRRLQAQLQTTQGRLDDATRQLQVAQSRLEEVARLPPPAPVAPTPPPAPLISDKDREEYGEDLISLIGRVLDHKIGSRLDDAMAKISMIEGRLGRVDSSVQSVRQTAQQTAQQRYEAQLDSLIPGWSEVNEEQGYIDWLENRDTLSGKKYMELLLDAHQSMDAARVSSIFLLYKPELRASAPQPAGTQPTTPEATVPIIDPMTLAAPNTSPAAPAPAAPPAGKIWSQADVNKLFDDKQKKRISQQVFEQREAEYLVALAEGRVAAS